MTNNPNFVAPPVEQKPTKNNWNANEFGLNPKNIIETLAANFLKVFGYCFGWDNVNSIWRALRTDDNGNLLVSNGTQNTNAPSIVNFAVTSTPASAFALNPLRRAFAIYNDGSGTDGGVAALIVTYPSPTGNYQLYLPVGAFYVDDTWQGEVFIQTQSSSWNQNVTLIEYF